MKIYIPIMSLIDHFYTVFSECVVFQILTYKPHPCAELIKKDVCLMNSILENQLKNLPPRFYCLYIQNYIEGFRCLRKVQKLIKKKEKLEENIKNENKKLDDSLSCVSFYRAECKNSESCIKLSNDKIILCNKYGRDYCYKDHHYCGYVVPCVHSEEIKTHEHLIENYRNKIQIYRLNCKIAQIDIDNAFNANIHNLCE